MQRGLFDLDMEVGAGEVFGFLGPNGAGKTTTIRLLMGMIFPTRRPSYALLTKPRQDGPTISLSPHVLSEVKRFGAHVGITRRGRLFSIAGLDELHPLRIHHVEIEFAGVPPVDAIKEAEGVSDVRVDGSRVRCNVRGGFEPLLTAIAGRGVLNLVSEEPSLEELFLSYYRDEPPLESAAT